MALQCSPPGHPRLGLRRGRARHLHCRLRLQRLAYNDGCDRHDTESDDSTRHRDSHADFRLAAPGPLHSHSNEGHRSNRSHSHHVPYDAGGYLRGGHRAQDSGTSTEHDGENITGDSSFTTNSDDLQATFTAHSTAASATALVGTAHITFVKNYEHGSAVCKVKFTGNAAWDADLTGEYHVQADGSILVSLTASPVSGPPYTDQTNCFTQQVPVYWYGSGGTLINGTFDSRKESPTQEEAASRRRTWKWFPSGTRHQGSDPAGQLVREPGAMRPSVRLGFTVWRSRTWMACFSH